MVNYIGNIIDEIPEYMKGELATPASHHLFDIYKYTTKLFWTDADPFHHFSVQILYLSKWERPEIKLAVLFLCTRVRYPDVDE